MSTILNSTRLLAVAAVCAALAAPAFAQAADTGTHVKSSPGKASAVSTHTAVATITELDKAQRMVTLKSADGRVHSMQLGPDVRNVDQLSVGDKVTVKYVESLSLTLKKDGKELPTAKGSSGAARSAQGELPGGVVGEQVEVTADVVAVDTKHQIVTLKGPKQTVELRVKDPEQLKLIKVGDQIQAVYTQALAIGVTKAAAAKK
jgi:Cu/Ag efflux protein CusF